MGPIQDAAGLWDIQHASILLDIAILKVPPIAVAHEDALARRGT